MKRHPRSAACFSSLYHVFPAAVASIAEGRKGRMLLAKAIDLEEKCGKAGWPDPAAKTRATEAYVQAAEVHPEEGVEYI